MSRCAMRSLGRMLTSLAMACAPLVASAQNCGTGGGGNQTKFHANSGPLTVSTPTLTAPDYLAGQSQLTGTVTLLGCCAQPGSGTCRASVSLGAVGSPNLASVSFRVTSVSGTRCSAASPVVPLNTDIAITGTPREIFRMGSPGNNGAFCTVTIEFRGAAIAFASHLSGSTYERGISLSMVKS
jgi:hypothetical protein